MERASWGLAKAKKVQLRALDVDWIGLVWALEGWGWLERAILRLEKAKCGAKIG